MHNWYTKKSSNLFFCSTIILLIFFSSCRKDKICLDGQQHYCNPAISYIPLAVGNFWVYDEYLYNFDNYTSIVLSASDTMKVIGTRIIQNNEYFVIENNRPSFHEIKDTLFWRDSIGYIVDQKGKIIFTSIDFDNTFSCYGSIFGEDGSFDTKSTIKDSLFNYWNQNGEAFNCYNFTSIMLQTKIVPFIESWDRQSQKYFSKNVGIVYESITPIPPDLYPPIEFRREIKEYHLE